MIVLLNKSRISYLEVWRFLTIITINQQNAIWLLFSWVWSSFLNSYYFSILGLLEMSWRKEIRINLTMSLLSFLYSFFDIFSWILILKLFDGLFSFVSCKILLLWNWRRFLISYYPFKEYFSTKKLRIFVVYLLGLISENKERHYFDMK